MTGLNLLKLFMAAIVIPALAVIAIGCGDTPVEDNNTPEQLEGDFTIFTSDNGLVQNWVNDFLVDYTRGGVWFATIEGVSFHHSIEDTWTSYGPESTLPSLEVNSIAIDNSTATIWAGTASGVAYLSGDIWIEAGADSLVNRYVTKVAVFNGEIWVGTRGGLSIRSNGSWSILIDTLGLLNTGVTDIASDAQSRIWIGTPEGIAVYDQGDWSYFGIDVLPSPVVNAIFRTHDGWMWVGTSGGIGVFNGLSWQLYTVANGLPAAGVNAIAETREYVIWMATDEGPAYLAGGGFTGFALPDVAADAVVTSLALDMMTDDIWFGTMTGAVRFHK